MKELFVFMANALPMADLLSELKKAIIEHEKDPTENSLTTIDMWCTMLGTKQHLDKQSPEQLINDLNRMQATKDLLNPKEN